MVPTKITVDELKFRKTIYSKAAKNLRDVIATVKKARSSIGNDRMFAEARNSLGKLAENMERRATVLEALAEALVYSTDTYKGGQTKAVTSISDYKAHKTDFYGKPVHVSGAAGGAAAAAAGGAASAGAHAASSGSAATGSAGSSASGTTASAPAGNAGSASSDTGVTTAAGSGSAHSASGSAPAAEHAAPAASTTGAAQAVSGNTAPETAVPNAVDTAGVSAPEAPADIPAEQGSTENAGMSSAAMFGAGFAAAAAAGGAAAGAVKVKKNADKKKSVDFQIETARAKLQAIEAEENRIKASRADEDDEEQGEE